MNRVTRSSCLLWRSSSYFSRRFAVKTPWNECHLLNLAANKITQLQIITDQTPELPLGAHWEKPNPIRVVSRSQTEESEERVHFYCGGLPALMQAARKVENLKEGSNEKVVYVNDGLIPKTIQSGHQAHVHPSEWTAEECKTFNLFTTLLRGLGILPQKRPTVVSSYSYLHFPLSFTHFLSRSHLALYAQFFKQRMVHNVMARDGISKDDRWLCASIKESLQYHKTLSNRIQSQQGAPTFVQGDRVYWSPHFGGMHAKQTIWSALDIPTIFLGAEDVRKTTLLKDPALHVLRICGDGKFYPDSSQRILHYLGRNYPYNFVHHTAAVTELHVEKKTGYPFLVREKFPDGAISEFPITSFFCSPGHNNVFYEGSTEPLWLEVPVSGISSLWRCTIDKKEMIERLELKDPSDETIKSRVDQFLPAANLCNLHATTWKCRVSDESIIAYVRVSQGANFNSFVADKDDLRNMWENLDRFFIGDWELISVGTCTRKTHISNVPEYVELSSDSERTATFLHGLSGIGYSFSGVSLETLKKRPK